MGFVANALIGGVVGLVGGLFKKKSQPAAQETPKPIYAQPEAQPRTNSLARDAVFSRTGTRSNQRTGSRGAEPGSPGASLGGGGSRGGGGGGFGGRSWGSKGRLGM